MNRTLHPKASEYTFFSGLQGTLSRIYHMLGDKMGLGKCKKTDITPSIFLITLRHQQEITKKKKNYKKQKHVEAKQYAAKQLMDTEEIKDEI